MVNLHKSIILCFALISLVGAFVLFYSQPSWLFAKKHGGKALYGHVTSFTLSDVEMLNQQGEHVSWSHFSDKPLYLTLGFTSCPNTCPVTMSHYQRLANHLSTQANYSLLTIDPERDKPEVLDSYLGAINQNFVGLVINETKRLNQVTAELKQSVFVAQQGQQIIHKGYIYLIHPQVKGLVVYDELNLDIEKMVADFYILNGGKQLNNLAKNLPEA